MSKALAALGCLVFLGAPLLAQRAADDQGAQRVDPYTENDPAAMRAAGYVSFGPFDWADGHGTRRIEEVLGDVPILWVETTHFRIGCSLPPYTLSREKKEREKIRAELERLQTRLPTVDPKTRKLDRWLRLHLTAQRAEELYAEISDWLGVRDEDFPSGPEAVNAAAYMGQGPYLGQTDKYTVLLFEKAASFGRYSAAFLGGYQESAKRHNFQRTGSLFFGTSEELFEGALRNDTAMHCHLVFSLAQNLVDGYKFYHLSVPIWLKEGLAHWFSKRVAPEHNNYSQVKEYAAEMRESWDWAPRVRGRVRHRYYPSSAEMFTWSDYDQLGFTDHMILWSRVDYLMSLGKDGFATFMAILKQPIAEAEGVPGQDLVLQQQARAMQEAWGLDAASLDERWSEWVLQTYPSK